MKKIVCIVLTLVMMFSLSLSASAKDNVGDKGTVKVNGQLWNDATEYDITFETSVIWYVTDKSFPDVTNDLDGNTTTHKITNNTPGSEVIVKLDSFIAEAGDAQEIADKLDLHLTGNLAADGIGNKNLAKGYTGTEPYSAHLINGTPWEYGFTGTYDGTLVKEALTPTYDMIMSFSFAESRVGE